MSSPTDDIPPGRVRLILWGFLGFAFVVNPAAIYLMALPHGTHWALSAVSVAGIGLLALGEFLSLTVALGAWLTLRERRLKENKIKAVTDHLEAISRGARAELAAKRPDLFGDAS